MYRAGPDARQAQDAARLRRDARPSHHSKHPENLDLENTPLPEQKKAITMNPFNDKPVTRNLYVKSDSLLMVTIRMTVMMKRPPP